ncbi:ABC transporter permease [Actinomycetota bacterium]
MNIGKRLRAIYERRGILKILVRRDLRVRYARSVLGYLWTILDPLAMALIYFMIFAVMFPRTDPGHKPYFLFLIVGLLVWQWFSGAVTETGRALLVEQKLVRSTSLPRELWVIRVVIAKGIEFLLSLPILAAFTAWYAFTGEAQLNWRLVFFPVAILQQFLLLVGIGLLLAPITVLMDDMTRVVRIILRMMFYMTPVIFVFTKAPPWLQSVFKLNPVTGLLETYRAGFFHAHVDKPTVLIGWALTLGLLAAGLIVFSKLERAVLKEI